MSMSRTIGQRAESVGGTVPEPRRAPIRRRRTVWRLETFALLMAAVCDEPFVAPLGAGAPERPNILWLTCEDTGPELGCYGDAYADTPNLDRLAAKSLRYLHAWSTAPVCAPARTAIITGVYPPSLGGQHMRSEVRLPSFMRLYPQYLRDQGYYCTNNSKEDYNVAKPGQVWDDSSRNAHWRNRPPGQPFFAIFNFTVSHESQIRVQPHTLKHDPAKAPLPAYHPDTPEVRHDWAQYYDKVTEMDAQAGARLRELEEAGLANDTIVFFYGDHGSGMPRSKRWPYNSGLHVPLIVHVPERWQALAPKEYAAGGVSKRLVGFVDLAPTVLSLAGMEPPDWMQGRAFMGPHETPPPMYLHGFRGRMDERYDLVRSVRNERYIYLRQYRPDLIYGQHIGYMFVTPTTRVWKQLFDEGKLEPPKTFFWERKPPEELYDLEADPDEVRNLVGSPAHQPILRELRLAQQQHALEIRDLGLLPEGMMHERAGATTPFEMGHDPERYDLPRILATAEVAASRDLATVPELRRSLKEADDAIRYWAVCGLLIRGSDAVQSARGDLEVALGDDSASVRLMAAWALGEFGPAEALPACLTVLRDAAPADRNGAYTSVLALNIIDKLGVKAASLREYVKDLEVKDPKAPSRANGYAARLQATILGE